MQAESVKPLRADRGWQPTNERRRSQVMTQNKKDPATTLNTIVGEADELIRRRLKELGLEVPHVVVAVTPQGEVILRSNVSAEVLRSFGEDLTNLADDLTATPNLGDTTH
jgi:hypothetical protein